jgi:hypothetical protein
MRFRVLTPRLRESLSPDELHRLEQTLQYSSEEEETPALLLNGLRCHGEVPSLWAVRLGIRLGDFVCGMLSAQEGQRIDFKAAILSFRGRQTFIWWKLPGELFAVRYFTSYREAGISLGLLRSRAHPPMLALPEIEIYPMDVSYSVSAGLLRGRAGNLVVSRNLPIQDQVFLMS